MNKQQIARTALTRLSSDGKLKSIGSYLAIFWSFFQSQNDDRSGLEVKYYSNVSQSKKLDLLRIMSEIIIKNPSPEERRKMREGFNESRNTRQSLSGKEKLIYNLSDRCFVCGELPKHRHHIIQIQHGGRNTYRNIVDLCVKCHRRVHN